MKLGVVALSAIFGATLAPPAAAAVPISWRSHRFTKLASGYTRTHPGEAGVTPARFVTWVKLKLRGTNKKVIVVTTHLISGAWSPHPERWERWYTHMRTLRGKVRALHSNHPNARLFVVGDFNRRRALPMPSPLKYTPIKGVPGVRLDHMYAPTNVQHSKALQRPKWGSDHHAYTMWARL